MTNKEIAKEMRELAIYAPALMFKDLSTPAWFKLLEFWPIGAAIHFEHQKRMLLLFIAESLS